MILEVQLNVGVIRAMLYMYVFLSLTISTYINHNQKHTQKGTFFHIHITLTASEKVDIIKVVCCKFCCVGKLANLNKGRFNVCWLTLNTVKAKTVVGNRFTLKLLSAIGLP